MAVIGHHTVHLAFLHQPGPQGPLLLTCLSLGTRLFVRLLSLGLILIFVKVAQPSFFVGTLSVFEFHRL